MVDIPTFFPVPASRPNDAPQQRPEGQAQQQKQRFNQAQATSEQAQRGQKAKVAPLNVIPTDDAIERLVARAQDAQTEGRTLERGTILNLVI